MVDYLYLAKIEDTCRHWPDTVEIARKYFRTFDNALKWLGDMTEHRERFEREIAAHQPVPPVHGTWRLDLCVEEMRVSRVLLDDVIGD